LEASKGSVRYVNATAELEALLTCHRSAKERKPCGKLRKNQRVQWAQRTRVIGYDGTWVTRAVWMDECAWRLQILKVEAIFCPLEVWMYRGDEINSAYTDARLLLFIRDLCLQMSLWVWLRRLSLQSFRRVLGFSSASWFNET